MYDPTKPYKKQILELIEQTWETPYVSITKGIYPIIKKKFSCLEVDHTDGIGTKGVYHWQKRAFKNATLDALAMNLNDLALARATAYKLMDHILIQEDDKDAILEIIEALVDECKKRKIAVSGGETSIHQKTMEGIDISISVCGFIKDYKPNKVEVGDYLIGIGSSGLHSNGFTKVREVFGKEFRPEFVTPTYIYLDAILDLNRRYDIHGMMHITGGAFTKLKDILDGNDAIINDEHKLKPQKIFYDIYEKGVPAYDIYRIFNCGIGFVLSVSGRDPREVVKEIEYSGLEADIIGKAVPGNGKVKISSMFSNQIVTY